MSKAKEILENLTQFTKAGSRMFRSSGATQGTLEAGIYNITADMRGILFEKAEIKTDALIKINTSKYNYIMSEIDKFWESKSKFTDLGFTDKRAFIAHSIPGTGKSCIFKMIMESHNAKGNITFIVKDLSLGCEAIKEFREVEPERKVLVILEELDEILYSGSKALSDMLDGPTSVGGIFWLASTNRIDAIPERLLRPSRFDRVVKFDPPTEEDRFEYFKAKLGINEDEGKLREYAKLTDGFTFAHLKEFLVSVCCLDNPVDDTIVRLKKMDQSHMSYSRYEESAFQEKFNNMLEAKKSNNPITQMQMDESLASRIMKSYK